MGKKRFYAIPCIVVSVLLCAAVFFSDRFQPYRVQVAGGALMLVAITALCYVLAERRRDKRLLQRMDTIFSENAGVAAQVIREVSIPCAVMDDGGRIIWKNDSFDTQFNVDDIHTLIPAFDPKKPLVALSAEYNNNTYQVMSMRIRRPKTGRDLTMQYWIDRTEATHYRRLLEDQMPYVALIYVDNYEELAADVQFHRTTVLAEVERLIADTVHTVGGVYRRYDNNRFYVVFEAQQLALMEEQKFPLLEAARRIDTGTNASVSLSIAVGVADRIFTSDESARQAMELALGRGGDQAIVKSGTHYRFYGGKRQLDSMQSRVKTRLFSKALRQLFENAGDVFITGHKRPDMDCIGAALGIAACVKQLGSRAYIVLEENNASIDRAISLMQGNRAYASMLLSPEQAEKAMRPSSVLVVVDTQRPSTVCAPKLLGLSSRLVIIDHHRRSTDHIENPTLHYLESRASSASEIVTEVVQYFDDNMRPPAFVCGTLLAGITVDTKHFAFNVGSRTFEAAAYLRKNGADISMVKQLFQEDMESFGDCANTVRSADVIGAGIALSSVEEGAPNAKLIAAKAADELIGIRGIEAAFVLGLEDGSISVSGRSLGNVNVQLICEKMGGGGHLTMSGAQLVETDLDEAEAIVRSCIEQYIEEAGNA